MIPAFSQLREPDSASPLISRTLGVEPPASTAEARNLPVPAGGLVGLAGYLQTPYGSSLAYRLAYHLPVAPIDPPALTWRGAFAWALGGAAVGGIAVLALHAWRPRRRRARR